MKKKRFYKNIKRNQKWTEEEKGYPVEFADKYAADEGIYSDKYDYMRPKTKKKRRNKIKARKVLKGIGIAVLCYAVISVGYTFMGVYMDRNAMPVNYEDVKPESESLFNEVALDLNGEFTQSISLDGSVMLDSVTSDLLSSGCNSVMFDIKRSDGSIGYKSSIATVDTYGAVAFPATDLRGSVAKLAEQDILAVARVYCYLDNLTPEKDHSAAILNSNSVPYTDKKGNAYLNPDSEIAYKYIKDIIAEAMDMGITVFVLDGTDLPENIADKYNDGFDYLAQRLYSDLGTDIKLLEAVDFELTNDMLGIEQEDEEETTESSRETDSEDTESSEKETTEPKVNITELLPGEMNNNKVYCITVESDADTTQIRRILEEGGVKSFILCRE